MTNLDEAFDCGDDENAMAIKFLVNTYVVTHDISEAASMSSVTDELHHHLRPCERQKNLGQLTTYIGLRRHRTRNITTWKALWEKHPEHTGAKVYLKMR